MTKPSAHFGSLIQPTLVVLLDLLAASLVIWLFTQRTPTLLDFLAATVALTVMRHGQINVWRKKGVVIYASVFAAIIGLSIAFLGTQLGFNSSFLAQPWVFLLLPIPGHCLAALQRRPRKYEICIQGPRPIRNAALTWLRESHHHPYRSATSTSDVESVSLDGAIPGDLTLTIATRHGDFPLYPEGPDVGMSRAVKRALDLTIVGLMILPCTVLTICAAIAVLISMGRPVFYSQERLTRNHQSFRILKLRTMIVDAEPQGLAVWPRDQDPRITPLGRILRRLWIDELPQLWNVLLGDMSLVGPRPERLGFVQEFETTLPSYHLRYQVPAGMTGLAQARGLIGNTSIARRLRQDVRYILTWSPGQDLRLLGATACQVARRVMKI